jgi:ethanolamine-phosphate cytidylyltransferase
VRGCKWVDEVVTNVPYIMNDEYLKEIIVKYRIDYIVHGDDPCIVDGKDVYEAAQRLGKYLTIPRTEEISTTAMVGRILIYTYIYIIVFIFMT